MEDVIHVVRGSPQAHGAAAAAGAAGGGIGGAAAGGAAAGGAGVDSASRAHLRDCERKWVGSWLEDSSEEQASPSAAPSAQPRGGGDVADNDDGDDADADTSTTALGVGVGVGVAASHADILAAVQRDAILISHIDSPLTAKPIKPVYADWSASGRPSKLVENYINSVVLPCYANTHTDTSYTGLQSTAFRHEARRLIATACNARVSRNDKNADVVLFAGHGATGAANKLVAVLGLNVPYTSADTTGRPVVIVGPHEHHSNLLPWRESCADVVAVPERDDQSGRIDADAMRGILERESSRTGIKICALCATSNVTGIAQDVDTLTELAHEHGFLAVWDYASAASHAALDMNPPLRPRAHKDAVFLSVHKWLGGVNTPGVLLVKRRLLHASRAPAHPGGGTVFFVTDGGHRYLSNREEREEGGTPDIVGAVRAGLAASLRRSWIQACDGDVVTRILYESLAGAPNVKTLGPSWHQDEIAPRAPVLSFVVEAPECVLASPPPESNGGTRRRPRALLHHAFVCALLNDLFGVQARAGCMCAGPYAIRLLGLSAEEAHRLETALTSSTCEALRIGFVRVSFPPFAHLDEVRYVAACVACVAELGWRALPSYRVDEESGTWRHVSRIRSSPERKWLADAPWPMGTSVAKKSQPSAESTKPTNAVASEYEDADARRTLLDEQLANGKVFLTTCAVTNTNWSTTPMSLSEDSDALRWFAMPGDAAAALAREAGQPVPPPPPPPREAIAVAPGMRWLHADDLEAGDISVDEDDCNPAPPPMDDSAAKEKSEFASATNNDSAADVAPPSRKYPHRPAGGGLVNATTAMNSSDKPAAAVAKAAAPAASCPWRPNRDDDDSDADTVPDDEQPVDPEDLLADMMGDFIDEDEEEQDDTTKGDQEMSSPSSGGARFYPVPAPLMHATMRALQDFDMIAAGDRVLLGLSGGKDSLSLLHVLVAFNQRLHPSKRFELACATVEPGSDSFDPSPLKPYLAELGVKYHYIDQSIIALAKESMQGDSLCAFCARMKRGALYTCCRDNGYNKLALGQHLDDEVESFFMSALHNGRLSVMKAKYGNDAGDVAVIRPFVYVREKLLRDFAHAPETKLPVIEDNCPACFEAPKERRAIKKMLAKQEAVFPDIFNALCRTMSPLMEDGVLTSIYQSQQRRVAFRKDAKGRRAYYNSEKLEKKADAESDDSAALASFSDDALLRELELRRRRRSTTTSGWRNQSSTESNSS
ncbi:tRNA-cytidine(32) 2-sulfurtransferase [Pseudoscourfieldia marina]